jgi:hypothetical protein
MCRTLCAYLRENYQDKFLVAYSVNRLDLIPAKYCIFRTWCSIENIFQKIFSYDIEYLSIFKINLPINALAICKKLLQLPKLKKIAICVDNKELCLEPNENLSIKLLKLKILIQNSNIQFVTTKHIQNEFEKEAKNKLIFQSYVVESTY